MEKLEEYYKKKYIKYKKKYILYKKTYEEINKKDKNIVVDNTIKAINNSIKTKKIADSSLNSIKDSDKNIIKLKLDEKRINLINKINDITNNKLFEKQKNDKPSYKQIIDVINNEKLTKSERDNLVKDVNKYCNPGYLQKFPNECIYKPKTDKPKTDKSKTVETKTNETDKPKTDKPKTVDSPINVTDYLTNNQK